MGWWLLGGGFYTGRTTNVPRPNRGGNNGYTGNRGNGNDAYLSPRSSRVQNGNGTSVISGRPSRGSTNGNYNPSQRPVTTGNSRPSRTEAPAARPNTESSRPSRTEAPARPPRESYTPPPSYNPPSRSEGSSGGSYGGGSSGGGGGTSRPSRGGGR